MFDCCLNKYIPKSTNDMIISRPAGRTYINGMCESFSFNGFHGILHSDLIPLSEYERIIE